MLFSCTATATATAENHDKLFFYIKDEQPTKDSKFLLYRGQKLFYLEPAILTEKDITTAYNKYNSHMAMNMTIINFSDAKKVHKVTKDNVRKTIILAVNSEVISVAMLMAEITDGKISVMDNSPTTDLVSIITRITSKKNDPKSPQKDDSSSFINRLFRFFKF